MYRLEIVAGRRGLDADHIAWRMFRLNPVTQSEWFTIYFARAQADLSQYQRDLLDGWCEEGDIITYECKLSEE